MSNKRQRELARAKYERQMERREKRRARKHDGKQIFAGLAVVAVVIGYAMFAGRTESGTASPTPTASDSVSTAPTPSSTDGGTLATGCVPPSEVRADNITLGSAPTQTPAAAVIDFATNCGVISVDLDPKAPNTGSIMTGLVGLKYFDGIKCHRLTTQGIFVLQCGDPKGDGTGGPGFSFADENLPSADSTGSAIYKRGTVAMANAGANTNGSQFFLVYQDSPLPPNYSVWGSISSGLDVIDNIAAAGVAGGGSDGSPSQDVVISLASTTP